MPCSLLLGRREQICGDADDHVYLIFPFFFFTLLLRPPVHCSRFGTHLKPLSLCMLALAIRFLSERQPLGI